MQMKNQYNELIALTKLYLLKELPEAHSIYCSIENRDFFKKWTPPKTAPQQTIQTKQVETAPKQPEIVVKEPKATPIPKEIPTAVEKKKETQVQPKTTILEEIAILPHDQTGWKKFISQEFPQHTILPHIPSDAEAKIFKEAFKHSQPPIWIIAKTSTSEERSFYENLSKAIQQHLGPSKIFYYSQESDLIELTNQKEIRLVLSSAEEVGSKIVNSKFILLKSFHDYQSDAALKRTLWNTIRQTWSEINANK